jgi:methylmalonyl-CoA/ethylmalonyl-CoA epimerase
MYRLILPKGDNEYCDTITGLYNNEKTAFMEKIEHIGIAVKSLSFSVPLFEKLLNSNCYKTELIESEKVNTAFFKSGDTKIELLESTHQDGVISTFIDKKGEGIHHIAFEVTNITEEMIRLKNEGFILLNEEPKRGADNKLVCFLHPRSTNAVLIELCQSIK